ncbi:MAG: DUF2946 family protein [Novosphingobium sp.]
MGNLRAFIRDHRRLAAVLLACALCIRALMPAGYMLASDSRTVTVKICTDGISGDHAAQIVIHQQGDSKGAADHAKADGTCPWSGLAMASTGGADAVLLALALAFVLALGFAPVAASRTFQTPYLRPPLRGPPALI